MDPYLIQIDSKGVIMNANDQFEALLSSNRIPHCLHQNIDSVFKQLGTAKPIHLQKFPVFEDMHLENKGVAIRWYAEPLPQQEGKSGWQLTGLEMPPMGQKSTLSQPLSDGIQTPKVPLPAQRSLRVKLPPRVSRKSFSQYTEQITLILDSITDGFFMLDKDFNITLFNQKAEKTLQFPSERMIGQSVLEVLPELIDIPVYKAMVKAFKRKAVFSCERTIPRLGLCMELNAQSFAQGMFVYIKDTTRRKKHEMLLELEKKVLEINSNQNASLGVTIDFFLEGIEKIFSGMYCAVMLVDEQDEIIQVLSAPSLPKDFSPWMENGKFSRKSSSLGNAKFTRKRIIIKNLGEDPRWNNSSEFITRFHLQSCWCLPMLNIQGNVLANFSMFYKVPKSPSEADLKVLDRAANLIRIIIENKQAEEKLKISNERYLLATKATNDVIWDWDTKSEAPFWSEGFYNQFGYKPGKRVNKRNFWESHIHPEESKRVVSGLEQFIQNKEVGIWQEEYRFRKANGQYALISDRCFLVYDKNGEVARIVGSMQDITEKKAMEKMLLQQEINKQKLIVQAVVDAQEKDRAQIGKELHDNVNQILSTTKLYLELARCDEPERMNLINRSVKNINHAINEIRNISRSLVPPSIGDLGLLDSIKDLIESIKAIKAIHVEFYPIGPVEEKLNEAQKLMLFRIIQEQVNNVLKHSEAKNLIIELNLVDAENRVELNITDDGKGFESIKIKGKKGLGLSNITSRASLFGGKVSIVSANGEGCKLSVHIHIYNL